MHSPPKQTTTAPNLKKPHTAMFTLLLRSTWPRVSKEVQLKSDLSVRDAVFIASETLDIEFSALAKYDVSCVQYLHDVLELRRYIHIHTYTYIPTNTHTVIYMHTHTYIHTLIYIHSYTYTATGWAVS
jgi:hypothetical protein